MTLLVEIWYKDLLIFFNMKKMKGLDRMDRIIELNDEYEQDTASGITGINFIKATREEINRFFEDQKINPPVCRALVAAFACTLLTRWPAFLHAAQSSRQEGCSQILLNARR